MLTARARAATTATPPGSRCPAAPPGRPAPRKTPFFSRRDPVLLSSWLTSPLAPGFLRHRARGGADRETRRREVGRYLRRGLSFLRDSGQQARRPPHPIYPPRRPQATKFLGEARRPLSLQLERTTDPTAKRK